MRSRSRGSILVSALPRCLCVPRAETISNDFKWPLWPTKWCQGHLVQIWSLPCPSASVYHIWWGDLCDLENKIKVTQLKAELWHALVFLFPKYGEEMSNISSDIAQKPSAICRPLEWITWPWKWGHGHPVRTWSSSCPSAPVYHIWWGWVTYSWDIEQKPSFMSSS